MLIVISPAKTLDYVTQATTSDYTQPDLLDESAELIAILQRYQPDDLAALMTISHALAELNVARYASWSRPFTLQNAKQALFAFKGDVYEGLAATTLAQGELTWLQQHLRILSGLYGILRPLDLMQPYRLEMGTRLITPRGKTLYSFWGDRITEQINTLLERTAQPVLVNLSSEEYFKVIRPQQLKGRLITPVFQDKKGHGYKVISFYAKHARGMMTRWAAKHQIAHPDTLKEFNDEGYRFNESLSNDTIWVFQREHASSN